MIGRREFITLLGGAAVWPIAARGQQGERMRRVGVLMIGDDNGPRRAWVNTLRAELAELGWIEGRNLHIDIRLFSDEPDRVRNNAMELVRLAPDAIVVQTTSATKAVQQGTQTIPI